MWQFDGTQILDGVARNLVWGRNALNKELGLLASLRGNRVFFPILQHKKTERGRVEFSLGTKRGQ